MDSIRAKFTIATLLWVFVLFCAGCASTPNAKSLVGLYVADRIHDGSSQSTELTLSLYPNGRFAAWQRMYFNGEPVRISALAAYDLHANSQGTWWYADHRLHLTSDGRYSLVGSPFGSQRMIEGSEAIVSSTGAGALIKWGGVTYTLHEDSLQRPTGESSAQTRFSGVP